MVVQVSHKRCPLAFFSPKKETSNAIIYYSRGLPNSQYNFAAQRKKKYQIAGLRPMYFSNSRRFATFLVTMKRTKEQFAAWKRFHCARALLLTIGGIRKFRYAQGHQYNDFRIGPFAVQFHRIGAWHENINLRCNARLPVDTG